MNYNYFKTAITAFMADLNFKFHNYKFVVDATDFPVYISTTGDTTYHELRSDRLEVINVDSMRIPHMSLSVQSVSLKEEELSGPLKESAYVLEIAEVESAKIRASRIYPFRVEFEATVKFSNIFEYLAFIEYIVNGVYKELTYEFTYFGKHQMAQWKLITPDFTNEFDGELGYASSSEAGIHTTTMQFELHLPYYSFNLNGTLGPNGIGTSTGDGVNDPTNGDDGTGGSGSGSGDEDNVGDDLDEGNVISKVTHHVDDRFIERKISSVDYIDSDGDGNIDTIQNSEITDETED